MLKQFLNNYFGFNKQQRNGLLLLASLSFFLLVVRISYPYFIQPDKIVVKNLPLIENKIDSSIIYSKNNSSTQFSKIEKTKILFEFNPNRVTCEQLIQLGFKEKVAKTFIKFRDKGFVFKQKSDVKKIYGISDDFYNQLEPYINIETTNNLPSTKSKDNFSIPSKTKKSKNLVELNSADSLSLLTLKGIGPSFAKRIISYRTILGGFISIEQLKEVYGFTPEMYDNIKSNLTLTSVSIKKINLNKDDFKTINKHPYLSYELTKAICNGRRKKVITLQNLKELITDESVYNKLTPYLVFD